MEENSRQMVKIIKEICQENNISIQGFSHDWILQLCANNRTMFIYGYKFPNNNASVEQLCSDKSALSDILSIHGIPHIPHHFFMSPNNRQFLAPDGDWGVMQSLLRKYKKVVCKPNAGTGGHDIYKVSSNKDLEYSVHMIFSKSRSMSLSPYRDIRAEYRVIIVNSSVGVIYEKKRPSVVGDGSASIKQLIERDDSLYGVKIDDEIDLSYIPAKDEKVEVAWKHNLGQGAHPVLVTDFIKKGILTELALSCVVALEIEFMSIDIVEDEYGFEIMEINSGVMMENLSKSNSQNYAISKNIYQKAIFAYLGMDSSKYKYFVQKPRNARFVLPVLEQIAQERNIQIIPDKEEGNFAIFVFRNGHRFVAKDYPFNINSAGSISLCTNKAACASFLRDMGFNIPKQKYFVRKSHPEATLFEIGKHFDTPEELLGFGFPMILKPNSLSQGTGVFKVFNSKEGLLAAREVLSLKEKLILLQEYCIGSDYRIVVLNHHVIQAYERIPFHIVGNGVDTIETLIQKKAKTFADVGRDKKVDTGDHRILQNISRQGYSLNTVLDSGVECKLQDIANLSLGGTTEDKTDKITSYYANLAIRIADSLNLKLCGIDIIAKDITDEKNSDYYLLEVNSAPGLDNYVFTGKKQENYVKQLYGMVFDYLESL